MSSIKDVAKLAGVSVAAVSKYLKTPENMREATRQRISEAIRELNYRPNPLAQSLRTGKTNIIAIALPEVENPYFTKIYKLLQEQCEARGLLAVLLKNATTEQTKKTAGILTSGLVDGVICYDEGLADTFISEMEVNVPIVKIGPLSDSQYPATVGIDLRAGMQKLCSHLEQSGVRRIGYIGPDNDFSSMQKIRAIRDYCENSQLLLDPGAFLTECNSYSTGYSSVKRLVRSGANLPDAIIVESDMIALGVLKGLIESGLRVPQDVRLSGYDNTDISQMSVPSLTSVHIPLEDVCTCAMTMLCRLMDGENVDPVVFRTDLQIRSSTMLP